MLNQLKLGSADWNLWPLGREYETTFPLFKKSGIQFIELGIYTPSKELNSARGQEIIALAREHGLEVTAALFSLTPDRWPDGAFSNTKSDFLTECKLFLTVLEDMNVEYANIWTGADLSDSNMDQTLESLKELNELASKFSGIVSIEYKTDTIFPDGETLASILSEFRHLKVLIDTGHAFALEENIVELINDLHSKNLIGAMHLGDAIPGDSDADLPCGRVHDFSSIMDTLDKINFTGAANFDLYGAVVDESGPGPLSILDESSEHIKKIIERHLQK